MTAYRVVLIVVVLLLAAGFIRDWKRKAK